MGQKTHKAPTENASEIESFLRTGKFILQSRVTGTIAMAMSSARPIASRATNEGISSHDDDGSHAADIGRHTSSGDMQSAMPNADDIIILIVINRRIESVTPNIFRMKRRADTRSRVLTHPQRISFANTLYIISSASFTIMNWNDIWTHLCNNPELAMMGQVGFMHTLPFINDRPGRLRD